MGWPKRRREDRKPDPLDSGFETPANEVWNFDATHLSPMQCDVVRDYARRRLQEPSEFECAVQRVLLEKRFPGGDWRHAAIEARITASGHQPPWSRDEIAGFVRDALVTARIQMRRLLASKGYKMAKWSGDEFGTIDPKDLPWPPKLSVG